MKKQELKILPNAPEVESAVLGAMLVEPTAFYRIADKLRVQCFNRLQNQIVFEAIKSLAERHQVIDMLTVVQEVIKQGQLEQIGGAYYITQLTQNVVSSAHLEGHALILLHKHLQRETIRLCAETMERAYDDGLDPIETVDGLMKQSAEIQTLVSGKGFVKLSDAIVETIQQSEIKQSTGDIGIKFKHESIRYIIPSVQPSDFMIIAARPSVGKTAFALEFAMDAAQAGKKTAFFSMEMSKDQLVKRILSSRTNTPYTAVYHWKLSDQQRERVFSGSDSMQKVPLYIDDSFNTSTRLIYSKALNLKLKLGLDLIVIDYLQLIGGKRRNSKNDEITDISRECKGIAKDLDVPVIALSQMSREVEKQGREPRLSDLRDSGAIEQDADIVAFLFRTGEENEDVIKQVGLKVEKHRNGALGKATLWLNGNYQRFTDYDPNEMTGYKPVREIEDYSQAKRESK